MKKILFLVFSVLISITTQASNSDLFKVDNQLIDAAFEPVSDFEETFLSDIRSFEELALLSPSLNTKQSLALINQMELVSLSGEYVLGIPSTLLGFCLGPIGVVTTNNTKDQINPATLVVMFVGAVIVAGAVYYWTINPEAATAACGEGCANAAGEIIGQIIGEVLADACTSACESSPQLLLKLFKF